jgi:putative transposase
MMKEEVLMKKSKYSDAQIMCVLKQAEGGVPVVDLCREHEMSSASSFKWRSDYCRVIPIQKLNVA